MISNKRRAENYADTIVNLFGAGDSLNVEIDSSFSTLAIEALEDRGCVVQHETDTGRFTIYLQGNRQRPAWASFVSLA